MATPPALRTRPGALAADGHTGAISMAWAWPSRRTMRAEWCRRSLARRCRAAMSASIDSSAAAHTLARLAGAQR